MNEIAIKYANGFSIAITDTEVQLLFTVSSPVINAQNGNVDTTTLAQVADIRLNPIVAKQLGELLSKQIAVHESKSIPLKTNDGN